METIICLSFATACISFTISQTILFQSFRKFMANKNYWLGELVRCGYCLGHWVSFTLVTIYQPHLFDINWVLDWFLTSLILAWLSGIQWILFTLLMDALESESLN